MIDWDYDNAPTDPHHGGKLTAEMAAERIAALERVVADFLALERLHTPDMSSRRRTFGYIRPGPALASVLDAARILVPDKELDP